MRILALVIAGLLVASGDAAADQRADLQAKGEQLAKDGRFGEAIDAFKAADRIQPRASHACLIALAYTRRELWPQAELFLSSCHERAKAGDPLPDWVPLANQQIKERLQTANVVEVSIEVKPAAAAAKVTVSSFAPDEVFEPRTIHLPPGTHVIFARASGFADKQQTIEIKDKTPQRVVIDLSQAPAGGGQGAGDRPPPSEPKPVKQPSRLGTYLMIGGGVIGLLGAGSHLQMSNKRKDLAAAATPARYDELEPGFERSRNATIALYAVATGVIVTGFILRRNAKREAATVSAVPLPDGGAFVSVGWSR